ncbi:Retrovirus-related Pol polyprotein from transposon TNT 1-94 [Cucumis melo var. makuwa]|uniref:Retrovirus-related Pol polyprotein from transposon TNT 1-94 n=1 Tax=Cucumis melo var. makuwa TaxID=1194695 RepID=A0A5A7SRG4_CUCMM|nr:Retrovirus-related Pol polyprotein from transposon TNT 1-94 [Cucumis melo var. makuwa]TYK22331.1 Retrovirus-related Pol polyprotein from transposon TNT 1-94 [Cucumis melo var. makuwa]
MDSKMNSLYKKDTWNLTTLPPKQKVVSCKWIFKKKLGKEGEGGVKYKGRLVARGCTQREGLDYNEIFSLVVKHTSISVLLAIVACRNLELQQLDVNIAFLHGKLEETIYMSQLECYKKKGLEI